LTMPTDKVTETFTGKEKDDETELSYFGARYLDQMLGMWVSVDAKRQFNSPYLYAGNGTNPVRFFDPNGKEITFASDLEKQMYIELRSSLTPMAQERIQVLEKSKNIYKLNYRPAETRNQEMVFDENGSVLSQDKGGTKNGGFVPKANGGDIFFDGTKESLGHELGGHGFQMEYLLGNALQQGLSGDDAVFHFNSKYTNEENFRIGVEKDAANAGGHDFDEEYYKN
jgi:RHS repeat-associated protein